MAARPRPARPEGAEYITAVNRLTQVIAQFLDEDSPANERMRNELYEFQERFQVGLKITLELNPTSEQISEPDGVRLRLWHFPAPRSACRRIPKHIGKFMEALPQVSINGLLSEDSAVFECCICLRPFAEKSSKALSAANDEGRNQTDSMRVLPVETNESQTVDDIPVRLPCGHVFGKDCIRSWLSKFAGRYPPTCPVCRFQLEDLDDASIHVNGLFYEEAITVPDAAV